LGRREQQGGGIAVEPFGECRQPTQERDARSLERIQRRGLGRRQHLARGLERTCVETRLRGGERAIHLPVAVPRQRDRSPDEGRGRRAPPRPGQR
jgi:hypothetical protein